MSRSLRPGRWPAAMALAAMGFAGCSLLGMFDEEPSGSCDPGTMRQAACGVCGHATGVEVCGTDGGWVLDSCDADPDDADGDRAAATACVPGELVDCDDGSATVHPGAAEECNAVDDDCDGETDEDFECVAGASRACAICSESGSQLCVPDCSSWGPCAPDSTATTCLIDSGCVPSGARAASSPCLTCDPTRSTTSWTSLPGCWPDESTGLVWEDPPSAPSSSWNAAHGHCAGLTIAGEGLGEWRLPTISELRAFVRGCAGTMAGGACGVTDECLADACRVDCTGCTPGRGPGSFGCYWSPEVTGGSCAAHWSASSCPSDPDGCAWVLNFEDGNIFGYGKPDSLAVRCVWIGP